MKKRYAFIALLLMTWALFHPIQVNATTPSLNQSQWQIQSVTAWRGRPPTSLQPPVHIGFGPNQQLYGSDGCNYFNGRYQLKPKSHSLSLSMSATSLMACPPQHSSFARAFTQALSQTAKYSVSGNRLNLLNQKNLILASFIKPSTALGGTNWKVIGVNMGNAFVSSLNTERMTAQFGKDGSLSGFSGCNHYSGRYTLNAAQASLRVNGPLASTKKMCVDPDLAKEEAAFLQAWSRVRSYQRLANDLTLSDSTGLRIITLRLP